MATANDALQTRARWLGYLGLLPLVGGTAVLASGADSGTSAVPAIQAYGAVILAFLGAIHWGRAMNTGDQRLMSRSVVPPLAGWTCLLMPPAVALPALAAAFALMLLFDFGQYAHVPWFRRLRLQLTVAVCGLLLASWALL